MLNTAVDPYALLQRVRAEPAALEQLADQEHNDLLAWLTSVLRDRDSAEDAVQDTWVVLSRGQWQFTPNSSDTAGDVRAWLRRIALRSALRRQSQNQSRQQLLMRWSRQRITTPAPCPIQDMEQKDRSTILQAALAELPSHLRNAVELRYRDGLAFPEIARKIGGSPVAARVRTWRALRMLRSRLLGIGVLLPGSCTSWACDLFPTSSNTITVSSNVMWFAWSPAAKPSMTLLSGVLVSGLILGYFVFSGSAQDSLTDNSPTSQLPANFPLPTQVPAWLYIKDDESSNYQNAHSQNTTTPAAEIPGISSGEILIDISIIDDGDMGEQFSPVSPTILSTEQGESILANESSSIISSPRILIAPRTIGNVQIIKDYAFIAGYEIKNKIPDPTIDISNLGYDLKISAALESDAIRILSTQIDTSELFETKQRTFTAPRLGGLQTFPWEEPVIRHQSSAHLPQEGIVVPTGAYLLVPLNKSERRYHTPNRRYTEPDTHHGKIWTLIKATAIPPAQDHAPARPIESI